MSIYQAREVTKPCGALEPWLYLWNGGGVAGGRCGIADGYIHPDFPSGPPATIKPTGQPINPYNQRGKPTAQGCRATTGT